MERTYVVTTRWTSLCADPRLATTVEEIVNYITKSSRMATELSEAFFWKFASNPYEGAVQADLRTLFDAFFRVPA
jgi:hypothetical protein